MPGVQLSRKSNYRHKRYKRRRPCIPSSKELVTISVRTNATTPFVTAINVYPLSGVCTFACHARNFRLVGTAAQDTSLATDGLVYLWALKVVEGGQSETTLNLSILN
jgi:hypothetical protein